MQPECFEEGELLEETEAKLYLSVGALLNYIGLDRPELQYSIKECMRKASRPSRADMSRLKRIGRYIVGSRRRALLFSWQPQSTEIDVFVDSDFAGCPRTRRSTAGGCVMRGSHCLKTWANTLPILALSSGEAELMAVVKGSQEGLGMQALLGDIGLRTSIAVRSDATAAIGMVGRVGLGKVRHLSVSDLWVQHSRKDGRISYFKRPGQLNPADLLTKAVGQEVIERHCKRLGAVSLQGRSELAPRRRQPSAGHGSAEVQSGKLTWGVHGSLDGRLDPGGAAGARPCRGGEELEEAGRGRLAQALDLPVRDVRLEKIKEITKRRKETQLGG